MAAMLDLDQLRTFVAIAESGSFTKAADAVHKTQSAVSMQMRRLEERIGKPIFARDGRMSKLTEEGERLLGYARRMVRLSDETSPPSTRPSFPGSVRLGTPDDYADRFLPEILARFARSNPRVEVSVDLRAVADADGHGAARRDRPRHRHRLRRDGRPRSSARSRCSGSPRAPTASRRRRSCRSRCRSRRASGGPPALDSLASRRPQVSRPLHQRQFDRDLRRRARRPCRHGARRVGASPRHARPQRGRRLPAPADLRDRHHPLVEPAGLDRSSTSSPSTSSPRSTTCRSRRSPPDGRRTWECARASPLRRIRISNRSRSRAANGHP